jgi:hypothetical protein
MSIFLVLMLMDVGKLVSFMFCGRQVKRNLVGI